MPSSERAADLERVLSRAAQECESKQGVWFGEGLPQTLRRAIEALGRSVDAEPVEVAFVEVSSVSPQGRATADAAVSALGCPVVGLNASTLEELASLVASPSAAGVQITRLICPVAVFDFSREGIRVREVGHGLTAATLQRHLPTPLWSGPDLKELTPF